eukprot:6414064-Amphidinium_carterae.1
MNVTPVIKGQKRVATTADAHPASTSTTKGPERLADASCAEQGASSPNDAKKTKQEVTSIAHTDAFKWCRGS